MKAPVTHRSRPIWFMMGSVLLLVLAIRAGGERRALADTDEPTPTTRPLPLPLEKPGRMQTTPMPTTRMHTQRITPEKPPTPEPTARMNTAPMRPETFPTTHPVPPKIEPMNTQRMSTTRPAEGSWR